MANKRSILLFPALAAGLLALAQTPPVITNHVDYDTWKAQFINPDQGPPVHPAPPTPESDHTRGGTATCNCWIQPDAAYTTIDNSTQWNGGGFGNGDDGSYGPINLPFGFYLYGQTYTTAYININGNISFGSAISTFSSSPFPTTGPSMVAPFWADVDLRPNGPNLNKVQFKVTPTALYVNWTNVGYYNQQTDKLNSFQVIITNGVDQIVPNGANVSFCYGTMQWTTGGASGGNNGFGGTPANVGANKGDGVNYIQFGRFDHPGTDYNGPFGAPSGIGWLSNKYFTFTTNITTANVPPVVTGQSVCDSLTVCSGQTTTLSVDFLSPEPNQLTVPTSTCATLSNYTVVSATTGNTANIVTSFTPLASEVGFHDVYFNGADNGVPPMTSTFHIVVQVLPSPELVSDSLLVCNNAAPFNMLSVLGGNAPPGGTWTAPDGSAHNSTFTPGEDANGGYTYAVGTGTSCAATGVATITNVAHAFAGNDASLAYCSWDVPDLLFPHIPGSPQTGGHWLTPGGTSFNGTLVPPTDAPGIYAYVVNGNTPCPNDTAFLSIAIPQAVHAGQDSSIVVCRDAVPFSMRSMLAGTPDATGSWADVNGASVPDLFNPGTGTIGVYTYTVPATAPCPNLTAQLTINLDHIPSAGLDSALVICANGGNTPLFPLLGGNPDPGGHWLRPDTSILPDGVLDPAHDPAGKYRYVAIGPGTCAHLSDTAKVNVKINPIPVITFTARPDSGCAPLQVTFTNTTAAQFVGGPCVWNVGDGSDTIQTCGSFTHTFANPGWYHLKLRITTPQGCTDQRIAPGTVLVDPPPVASFVFTPDPVTAGNSHVVFTATDPHAVRHYWTLPDYSLHSGRQVEYDFQDKIAGQYPVCLSVYDRYGCADTLCDTIPVFVDNLWVPTAFTPDGNGVNDVFHVVTTDMAPEDYHLMIFDRWGHLQFETTDMDKGWDGSGMNGGKCSSGIYVWRLEYRPLFKSDKLSRTGTITLLR